MVSEVGNSINRVWAICSDDGWINNWRQKKKKYCLFVCLLINTLPLQDTMKAAVFVLCVHVVNTFVCVGNVRFLFSVIQQEHLIIDTTKRNI